MRFRRPRPQPRPAGCGAPSRDVSARGDTRSIPKSPDCGGGGEAGNARLRRARSFSVRTTADRQRHSVGLHRGERSCLRRRPRQCRGGFPSRPSRAIPLHRRDQSCLRPGAGRFIRRKGQMPLVRRHGGGHDHGEGGAQSGGAAMKGVGRRQFYPWLKSDPLTAQSDLPAVSDIPWRFK